MIRSFSIALLLLFSLTALAQKQKNIVVTIGGLPIGIEEFEANYKKNNTNILDEKDKKTPAQYLDLFVNFKLKVLEAQKLGYDTLKSFIDELKGYRQELAKPYLTNVTFNEKMVVNAYHRTKYERKVGHILIRVGPDASPADTLAAWNKTNDIRVQVIGGADFNEMASTHSEDPSAAQNKGILGYFGAFQMVFPFEEAAYKTPVGQVSEIVRTRFGYHIIKVMDERENLGEIKVAHIMKIFPKQAAEETIAKLKLSADSIWLKATSGENFAELAKKYSDDKQSSGSGGEMKWFGMTNMVPEFAEASFALKNNGDISPVIRTPYGWHIIKSLERRSIDSFEKMRPDLETKIKQNPAISKYSDDAFERKLRSDYHLKTNDANFMKLVAVMADTSGRENLAAKVGPLKKDQLLNFANENLTIGDFAGFLKDKHYIPKNGSPEPELKSLLETFIRETLLEYENTQLEVKHPDFANVIREYHDGILLFNISKDKIWDVASADTARLQAYFNQTSKKYYWDERFKGWKIQTKDAETRTRLETMLDNKEMTKQEINDFFNTETENNVQISEIAVEKGDDPEVDFYIWNGPKPAGFNETVTFVHGKTSQNELKDLKDAWGLYSSDFQEQIEKEWIDSLRQKYPIVINKKVLKKIPMIG